MPIVSHTKIMNEIDFQKDYWDSVASEKTFTHPLNMDRFCQMVSFESKILDYGCRYGRTCAYLAENGYSNVLGVDISLAMINRGLQLHDNLKLQYLKDSSLPFSNDTFAACTLLAVLTCIPTDIGQKDLIDEIYRVLSPNGVLYVSGYPLQKDAKNLERYAKFESEFGNYGVFRLSDGIVVRHHDMPWIYDLLAGFEVITEETIDVFTMNGNKAAVFQIIAKKR
jgi:SAM-dependent methyltransferase